MLDADFCFQHAPYRASVIQNKCVPQNVSFLCQAEFNISLVHSFGVIGPLIKKHCPHVKCFSCALHAACAFEWLTLEDI